MFFGIFGLLYFNAYFKVLTPLSIGISFGVLAFVVTVLLALRKFTVRGYSITRLVDKVNQLPRPVHQRNIALAIGRYLIFSHQYYFLFRAFDVEIPYFLLMATICCVYFLASSLPTFQFLDFAVKGSVAVYFFGILGVNEWIVVFVATLMWLLNVVLPVLAGSYFVIKFKSAWKQE